MCCFCCGFLNTLKFYVEVTIFVLVIILCTLSSKEPFKHHIIGDISNYFTIPSTPPDSTENISLTDIILINSTSMPENIFQENLNNSYDIVDKKHLLKEKRQLASVSFVEIWKKVLEGIKVKNFHIFLILNIKLFVNLILL